MRADVVVVGAGPAGMAAAAATAQAGLRTVVLDPRPPRPWAQTFGAWADELPPGVAARASWDDVVVVTDRSTIPLSRRYVLLDNAAVLGDLIRRLDGAGGRVEVARVRGFRAGAMWHTVLFEGGAVATRSIIDASGHRPGLLRTGGVDTAPVQAAYGIVGRFPRPPASAGAMTLMDYSTAHLAAAPSRRPRDGAGPPTFLYAMDLGADRWFVEETSLAARPGVATSLLRARLDARLGYRGAGPRAVEHVEKVWIPMGVPVPDRRQPVVGFGAAAGMVHPATGFSVARALGTAPRLAQALEGTIAGGANAGEVARAGWSAVWRPQDLAQRRLHRVGLATLLTLDTAATQRFFELFFTAAPADWQGYVSGAERTAATMRTMARLFARAPMPLRRRMAVAAVRALRPAWERQAVNGR